MHAALDKGWAPLATGTVKGCKVQILDDGTKAAYRAGLAKRATIYNKGNTEPIYESAFRLTDTSDPTKVTYYLSQFQDSSKPCAASVTRKTYTTFFSKSGTKRSATGHECELISEPVTAATVAQECKNDPQCAGYYTSTDVVLPPVMATTEPGNCKVEWKLLPNADRPTTADKCTRDMGDLVWSTSSDGKCVPMCPPDSRFRESGTGLCDVLNKPDSCIKNWDFGYSYISGPSKYSSCVPISEAACPIGWTHQTRTWEFPYGHCTG